METDDCITFEILNSLVFVSFKYVDNFFNQNSDKLHDAPSILPYKNRKKGIKSNGTNLSRPSYC